MTTVVAALILRNERVLIARRRDDQTHAGKWEFPGGKVEPRELPEEALRRELREELGIEACVGAEVTNYEFAYPGKRPILLIFFWVRKFDGEIDCSQFAETRWARLPELSRFDFLEGDVNFVQRIAAGEFVAATQAGETVPARRT